MALSKDKEARVWSALHETYRLLNKELGYSPDLQKKDMIAFYEVISKNCKKCCLTRTPEFDNLTPSKTEGDFIMGRSYTPKYRVEYRDNLLAMGVSAPDMRGVDGVPCHSQAWDGKPSQKALEDWRLMMNKSFQPGGSNWHVSQAFNSIPSIFYASIVRQSDRKVMFTTKAPMFEVVG